MDRGFSLDVFSGSVGQSDPFPQESHLSSSKCRVGLKNLNNNCLSSSTTHNFKSTYEHERRR